MKKLSRLFIHLLLAAPLLLAGCQTHSTSELQNFMQSVRKELPFQVDSFRYSAHSDFVEFRFANPGYIATAPDVEIDSEGKTIIYRTTMLEPLTHQKEDMVWRNVVVSKKRQRVICIDRYLREGRTEGFVYAFQTESKKYPTYGTYHWDVSDSRHIEMMGTMLDNMHQLAVKRLKGKANTMAMTPESQDDYWRLMFHADSLYADRLYDEARQTYDLAFTNDRYIIPLHLSQVARKMKAVGDDKSALGYLTHRLEMEKDYYEEPSACPFSELKDTFALRQQEWGYDLQLKEQLEEMLERDQHDRIQWSQSSAQNPQDLQRNEILRQIAWNTDSINLVAISDILSRMGFPRRDKVGDFASLTTWMVFQHSDLDHQKQFLPQLEEAVAQGIIPPMYLAALQDRIDVREGRPQKYGTQISGDGTLCPLLDASRVNEWRKEVGLPPIEI